MAIYTELAFPLANSRGLGKFVRFDYQVASVIDLPLIMSPHVNAMGRPYYTRQMLYFLDDVECVIRWLVPDDEKVGDKERVNQIEALRQATNNCLFEYSVRHPESRLTITPSSQPPLIFPFEKEFSRHESGQMYLKVDHGLVDLLAPTAHEQFEDEYQQFIAQMFPDNVFDHEQAPWGGTPSALDFLDEEPATYFTKLPYTYEELELLSHIIPADPEVLLPSKSSVEETQVTEAKREWHIGIFMQPYYQRLLTLHPLKWLDQEIIKVNRPYNQMLLSFYFAGLGSLSPIVEFSNYYRVLEYFFEDATYENAKASLEGRLRELLAAEDFDQYQKHVKQLNLANAERDQIREVVNRYVAEGRLRDFLRNGTSEEARNHFAKFSPNNKTFTIQRLKPNVADICRTVADRIYEFRNAVFHAKRTRKGNPATSFRPNSLEEYQVIRHEAQLVKVVAQEIIQKAAVDA